MRRASRLTDPCDSGHLFTYTPSERVRLGGLALCTLSSHAFPLVARSASGRVVVGSRKLPVIARGDLVRGIDPMQGFVSTTIADGSPRLFIS